MAKGKQKISKEKLKKSVKDNGNKRLDGKIGLPEDIRVVFSEENNPHDG